MNIFLTSRNYRIKRIADAVCHVAHDKDFHFALERYGFFEFSNDADGGISGSEISQIIRNFIAQYDVSISIYRSWNPWSNVLGFFDPSKGIRTIHLNKWRLNRSDKSVFETIFHELIHVIDHSDGNATYFGHGNNSPVGKEKSAPWRVAKIAAEFYQP